jgi:hypothetical protein
VAAMFDAQLAASSELVGLGARVEAPATRAILSYWRPATFDATLDAWKVTLEVPATPGPHVLVWRTRDPEPPEFELAVPLALG